MPTSPTQANSGPNPVTTATTEKQLDTKLEAQPTPADRDAQEEEEEKTAIVTEPETLIAQQESGKQAETPSHMAVAQVVETERAVQPLTSENAGGMELDSAAAPASDVHPNSGCDQKKAKNPGKGVRDGRKYVPSKKAMIDPLKMDMSKQLVMPVTCEYFTFLYVSPRIKRPAGGFDH